MVTVVEPDLRPSRRRASAGIRTARVPGLPGGQRGHPDPRRGDHALPVRQHRRPLAQRRAADPGRRGQPAARRVQPHHATSSCVTTRCSGRTTATPSSTRWSPPSIAMVLTTCYAYVLSKKHLRGRGALVGIAVFTMFFTGGLIPNYVLISSLGLKNSDLGDRPAQRDQRLQPAGDEGVLREPADRAGGGRRGRRPEHLRHPAADRAAAVQGGVATMVLFYAVSFWNSWFSAFLYMDQIDLFPVTVYLRNLIAGATGGGIAGSRGGRHGPGRRHHPGRDHRAHLRCRSSWSTRSSSATSSRA